MISIYRFVVGKLTNDGVEAPDLEMIDSASLLSPLICFCTKYAYSPFFLRSSRWLPCSTILPWSMTIILSAFSMVLRRCATTTTVCPFKFLCMACCTYFKMNNKRLVKSETWVCQLAASFVSEMCNCFELDYDYMIDYVIDCQSLS